ncbi:MAG: GGDEF domain-containing protein [Terracidiphilus sp.]
MNWSELPDLTAVALLAGAFASVSRRSPTRVSGVWLTGWLMIVAHFAAFLFLGMPGIWGTLATVIGLSALVWAGLLFMWATVPYRGQQSSRWMLAVLVVSNTLYITVLDVIPESGWPLDIAAVLLGLAPLLVTLSVVKKFNHSLRWLLVSLYAGLSLFALLVQHRAGNGADLAMNAVIFTVYFSCCIHFLFGYRSGTAGAFITIAGFLAWSAVFVVAPIMQAFFSGVHVESEVWNLPKYVVAVGMILLLLEEQIENNRHLALHDYLTGLPNRRLFQDRLASALERARRTETQTALLVLDLNRFKEVNDTQGHHVGDLLLQQVAVRFSGRVRRSDTVARTGGDEFSIILEEPINREQAEFVGDSLRQLLNEPIQLDGGHFAQIGASVGVAVFPEDAHDPESLFIAADQRMYSSKRDPREPGVVEVITTQIVQPPPRIRPLTDPAFRGAD